MRIIGIVLLLIGTLSIDRWPFIQTLSPQQSELLRAALYLAFMLCAYILGYVQSMVDTNNNFKNNKKNG